MIDITARELPPSERLNIFLFSHIIFMNVCVFALACTECVVFASLLLIIPAALIHFKLAQLIGLTFPGSSRPLTMSAPLCLLALSLLLARAAGDATICECSGQSQSDTTK